MKLFFVALMLLLSFQISARTDVTRTLFLSKAPFHGEAASEDKHSDSFDMSGEFGVIYASGNTAGSTLTSKLNAKQDLKQWHNRYAAKLFYKQIEREFENETSLVTSAQRVFVSMQSDYKLKNSTHRLFIFGEYDDDRFSAYDYQAAIAVGWTEQVWADDISELTYSIGPGYARSVAKPLTNAQSQVGLIFRAAMEYETKLNEYATFRQYVSTETDVDFSRSVSETSVDAKINSSLKMKLSLNMTHNRSPQELDETLDTQTAVTLVYQFF
jgi:putative salt-induced outer membrane protein YdiY